MKNNNMVCDLVTGVCGVAEENELELIDFNKQEKSVDLYYVTDPICSHCWAIEPVIGRFVKQYKKHFNFHIVMGGLLEKWHNGPIDPANGIYKPADVAGHWREVGQYSRMPIDGSLMVDNPVQSSYPPSHVFKVLQKNYSENIASEYLRRAREAIFVFNKNIAERSVLVELVNQLGLDGKSIVSEAELPIGKQLLNEDLDLVKTLGVRGFPSIVIVNKENKGVKIVGGQPLQAYIDGLKQVINTEELQPTELPSLPTLLKTEKLIFYKEIEVMYDLEKTDVQSFINLQLSPDEYKLHEILGESYIVTK